MLIHIHQEKDHLWAQVPDIPGCFAAGKDLDEFKECLAEAIGMYLADPPAPTAPGPTSTFVTPDGLKEYVELGRAKTRDGTTIYYGDASPPAI